MSAEHGFVGYSEELLFNNTLPDYSQGESFFTVFGVFFPAATGTVSFILSFSSTGTSPDEQKPGGFLQPLSVSTQPEQTHAADSNVQPFLQSLKFFTVLSGLLEGALLSLCGQKLFLESVG